jgi:pimeloyl-ACP methyl ester carboxylesterase
LLKLHLDHIIIIIITNTYDRRLGNNATVEEIKKAGHLVNLERPCIYNRCLKKFLSSLAEIK